MCFTASSIANNPDLRSVTTSFHRSRLRVITALIALNYTFFVFKAITKSVCKL